jgi:methyl-accepting chemotaxis protein
MTNTKENLMVKFTDKLEFKLTAGFIFLILSVSCLMFFYTFSETKKALKNTIQDELITLAQVIASGIDGNSFLKLQEGTEKTKAFTDLRDRLYAAQVSSRDIKFIYTFRYNDDKSVKFVVDAEYGTSKDAAAPGELYTDITPQMMEGLHKPSVEKEFSMDKWGTVMSGYAPIFDSKGSPVGAVGVDMSSAKVLDKQKFIGSTLYLVFFLSILIAAIIIELFSKTIIRDIKKLNAAANDISKGSMDAKIEVKRNDEIGELADSFSRMSASLKIMMMDDLKNK